MSFSLKIEGLDDAKALMVGFSDRRANAAIATALTRTALLVRDAERQAMRDDLDRPTPYTLNSLWVQTATGNAADAGTRNLALGGDPYNGTLTSSRFLSAAVGIKNESAGSGTPATKYLLPQVEGGGRHVKRFERALQAAGAMPQGWQSIPGPGASIDAFGNVSRGQLIQILSQVGTELTAGHNRSMSKDPRKRIAAQRRASGRFFAVLPGGKLTPGIYQREFTGRNITPVLFFVRRTSYQLRLDFYRIASQVAARNLPVEMGRAVGEHIARLVKGGRA